MSKMYLIPDSTRMEESLALRKRTRCSWEFNDFIHPDVLDNPKLQGEIIDGYGKVLTDFREDTMHGAFFDITVHSIDPLIAEASKLRVRQSMDIAKIMGLRGVVFHTNRIQGMRNESYINGWYRTNEDFFRHILDDYPDQQIFMENMFDESPDVLKNFAEKMSDCPNFGVCLDYAHAALSKTPVRKWMQELGPYIRHMHVNDNDGIQDLHLPLGQGIINWENLKAEIGEFHINCTVLIEVTDLQKQYQSLEFIEKNRG